jgi:site-specific recombinase XerD
MPLISIIAEAQLPTIRFHDLRHSAASLLVAMGVPMKVIQEILGHSNFLLTADLYSHLVNGELQTAMNSMNDFFTDTKPAGRDTNAIAVQ